VKGARQDAIRRLLRTQSISTQEELGELLAREGFDVTQATLSRDLAQLGAMRVSLPEGGTVYSLEGPPAGLPPPGGGEGRLRGVGELVVDVDDNDVLVLLRTRVGAASAVAVALDAARLPEVMGSIAGDDTIFVAPARGRSTRALARRLKALLGRGEG
jgi:transcriptional regulator of arginine metabolism